MCEEVCSATKKANSARKGTLTLLTGGGGQSLHLNPLIRAKQSVWKDVDAASWKIPVFG